MQTRAHGSSPLSVHRSFVVQFRAETDAAHGRISGRIEHVASRQSGSFRSWTELQEFMAQILIRGEPKPGETAR